MQSAFRRHESSKEEQEYVDSIMEDIRWLGFDWESGSILRLTTLTGFMNTRRF
jgi:glutamyl/glutaminyl-tRNA synthetase